MSGKKSRDKGARGELELVKILQANGIDCHRGYVQLHQPDVVGVKGIHVEVKRQERLNLHAAMQQATDASREGEAPTVFHRKSYEDWLVTMKLDDWIKLYKKEDADVLHSSKGDT